MVNNLNAALTVNGLIDNISQQILNPLIGLFFVIAFVVFTYGVVEMIAGAGDEEKRSEGQKHIMWGLIGLFIMFSVYGIMNVIRSWLE